MTPERLREILADVRNRAARVRALHDPAREVMARAPHRHEGGTLTRNGETVPRCGFCRAGGNAEFEAYIARSIEVRKVSQHLPREQDQAAIRSLRTTMEAEWRAQASPAVGWAKRAAVTERDGLTKMIPEFTEPDSVEEAVRKVLGDADHRSPDGLVSTALLELVARPVVQREIEGMGVVEAQAAWTRASNGAAGLADVVRNAIVKQELWKHADGWTGKRCDPTKDPRSAVAARALAQAIRTERESRVPSELREALAECDQIVRWADLQVRGFRLDLPSASELDAMALDEDEGA